MIAKQKRKTRPSRQVNEKIQTNRSARQIGTAELPRRTLEECLQVAKPLHEVYAGKSASWDEIATAAGLATVSNKTKYLIWSAQAYDLLIKEGDKYLLSETARKILAPNYSEEKSEALIKAITVPTILSKFYAEYDGKLLPDDQFFDNVLESRYQIPRERTDEAKGIILANALYAQILTVHESGKRIIRLDGSAKTSEQAETSHRAEEANPESSSSVVSIVTEGDNSQVCFYITPIGEEHSEVRRHSDMLLRHLVEPAFQQFGFRVVRADKIEKTGLISQQIFEHIVSAKFCVADLSFGNPNAFYELGIRHMTRLPTIQIIRKGDKIPFDVSQGRTIVIDMSDIYTIMDRIESAKKELLEHIRNFIDPNDQGRAEDNPVSIYLPNLQIRFSR